MKRSHLPNQVEASEEACSQTEKNLDILKNEKSVQMLDEITLNTYVEKYQQGKLTV